MECGPRHYLSSLLPVVLSVLFGPSAVVAALEGADAEYDFLVLATNRTSTMQRELRDARAAGFDLVGVTVSSTTFGGDEVVAILKRPVGRD